MANIYALWRNPCGDVTFRKIGATAIPNPYGLELYLHHSTETWGEGRWWYVVEASSGASFARAKTGSDAVEAMFTAIINRGADAILRDIKQSIDNHGLAPDHRNTDRTKGA